MLPTARTSYDTAVKHLYRKGLETAIPRSLRSRIPKTNVSRWRNEPDAKYIGHALNTIAATELQLLQAFAENHSAKQLFRAWCRIALTIRTILTAIPQVQAKLRAAKKQIVEAIELENRGIRKVLTRFPKDQSCASSTCPEAPISPGKHRCYTSAGLRPFHSA